MRIYHPRAPHMGIPPQDVFFAADDLGNQIGTGFLIMTNQQSLYPDRPVNLYLQMDAQPSARYMLLGALIARAYQLRATAPFVKARIYTQISTEDEALLAFYQDSGFLCDDAEDRVTLTIPAVPGRMPMSCQISNVPMASPFDQQNFLFRINQHRISPLSMSDLMQNINMPHFLALGISKGSEICGEILLAGEGAFATVVSLYVVPGYRRLGMGKALLHKGMFMLKDEGVTRVDAIAYRRNPAQCALVRAFDAHFVKTLSYMPGINLD